MENQYIIKGGTPLHGEVTIGGAKNAALGILAAAIMTDDTGVWKQTIFYPYLHACQMGNGTVLQTLVNCPVYESKYGDAPYVDAVAVEDKENRTITLFAVNKDLEEDIQAEMDIRQYE